MSFRFASRPSFSKQFHRLSRWARRAALTGFAGLLLMMNGGCGTSGKPDSFGSAQMPEIATFMATPATITSGEKSVLSWSVSGATRMSISSGNGTLTSSNSVPLSSNSLTVTPSATTTYTLTATNPNGQSTSATVSVTVVDKPVIHSFTASPSVISDAQSSTLSFSVTGATSLTINQGVGDVTGLTSVTVSPSTTTTYLLTATSAAGTGSSSAIVISSVTVTVVPAPVITNFTATPSTISSGQSSTLSWSVSGATGVSIDHGVGTITGNNVSVNPTATTTYTLTASNTVGSFTSTSTAQATVTFSSAAVPTINSFTVDHPSVGPNGTIKLTANFDLGQGGGTATITTNNGATQIAQGSSSPMTATLPIASSTTFTLTVKNVDGNTATAAVRALAGSVTAFAGVPSVPGNSDGTGASASFDHPHGAVVDAHGNLFVADTNNNSIRMVTIPAAVVTTLLDSSTGLPAQFDGPIDTAVDSLGNVYVANTNNDTIDMITPAGVVTTLAGTAGMPGSNDSPDAHFNGPRGVAVDAAGNIYVTDTNNSTIRMITVSGGVATVTTLAGTAGIPGSNDSPSAHFNGPTGITVDATGNLYVTDTVNNTVRKIAMPGGVVSTLAGSAGNRGHADGTGAAATFFNPASIAVDPVGNLYVADVNNFTIRRITPAGAVSTIIGTAGSPTGVPGGPLPGLLGTVNGIALDPSSNGKLYINMQNAVFTAPY